jgi:LAO/AO transport system kinase
MAMPPGPNLRDWAERVRHSEGRAVAQAITAVENRDAAGEQLLRSLFPFTGRATLIGVTGAPGSGKSTLVDALAVALRRRRHSIGILAVDPSSPFTGGAILGDRIRMQAHAGDPGIFIRSMATRGALGGLAARTFDAAMILDAAGMEFILIETVGVGQDEVEIARVADATLLLLAPAMGDDVQALKAGVMEVADIFVLNKSDLPGADRLEADVAAALTLTPAPTAWQPPIVRTVASRGEGVEELLGQVFWYLEETRRSGLLQQRRTRYWRERILAIVHERLLTQALGNDPAEALLGGMAEEVALRRSDPYAAAEALLRSPPASADSSRRNYQRRKP